MPGLTISPCVMAAAASGFAAGAAVTYFVTTRKTDQIHAKSAGKGCRLGEKKLTAGQQAAKVVEGLAEPWTEKGMAALPAVDEAAVPSLLPNNVKEAAKEAAK